MTVQAVFLFGAKGQLKQTTLHFKMGLVSMDCRLWGGRPKGGLTDNRLLQLQQGLRSKSSFLLKVRKFSQMSLPPHLLYRQFVLPIALRISFQ